MKKKSLPDLLVPLYVLVLLVGVLVTKGYELLTLRGVAIAVALTACVLVILVGLVVAFQGKQHKDEFQLLLNRLQQLIPPSSEQLKVIPLPRHQFRFLSVTHIAVFNPGMTDGASSPDVYLELPIEDERSNKIRGYWIKVGRGAAKDLAGRFRKIVDANS